MEASLSALSVSLLLINDVHLITAAFHGYQLDAGSVLNRHQLFSMAWLASEHVLMKLVVDYPSAQGDYLPVIPKIVFEKVILHQQLKLDFMHVYIFGLTLNKTHNLLPGLR